MATKDSAKRKYVNSVSSPLALSKMTSKLSTYYGGTVTETAGPVSNWKKIVGANADALFDKAYANGKAAYGA